MALTIAGSSSLLQIHQFQISRKNTTTTKTRLVVVAVAKSGGGANNKNKSSNSSGSSSSGFKTGGKFDSKNRRTTSTTTLKEEVEKPSSYDNNGQLNGFQINDGIITKGEDDIDIEARLRELPGLEKDFWEGPEWDTFGFLVQHLWAFGILFALVACGVAVATYNEGAADFKQTPAYKESIQSREFLEEPESSNSDIFESNPTEEAPALE